MLQPTETGTYINIPDHNHRKALIIINFGILNNVYSCLIIELQINEIFSGLYEVMNIKASLLNSTADGKNKKGLHTNYQ